MRPGVNIYTKDTPPPVALPTEASVFVVGVTEKGPLSPVLSVNFLEWQVQLGARTSNTLTMFDSVETLFREGAKRVITSRVVGPTAATATIAVLDSVPATVFTATAKGPGTYGNDLNVVIRTSVQDPNIPVGSFRIRVQTDATVVLEESPDLLDKAAATYWVNSTSQYINYTDGASSNDPAAGTYPLAGGTDDTAGITDTQWATALDKFSADLGTGIVVAPGRTTDTGHTQVRAHVEANNRVGYLDAPNTATVSTLTTSASSCRSRFCGLFWPFGQIVGLTPGTFRTISPSVVAAGCSARNDALGKSPNAPAAGELGESNTLLGLSFPVTDADHQTLNSGGVNVIKQRFRQIKISGWRTTSSEFTDPRWVNLGNARLHRAIANGAWLVGERFLFKEIDGKGLLVSQWGGALSGEVMMPFFLANSLYGLEPQDAYRVDLSGNTVTTAQNRQLIADIIYVASEFGEEVTVNIAKQLLTEGVGA